MNAHNRLPDAVVAQIYADYQRLGSMVRAGALHGRNATTLLGIFRARGLPTLADRGERVGQTRRAHLDDEVARMHADYMTGLSLSEVGRRYGQRTHKSVRGLFVLRGLHVRPARGGPVHLENGCFKPADPLTADQIEAVIAKQTKLRIPEELRTEWRDWTIERRGDFIARVRARLQSPKDRPTLPFSANVEPFDYTTPKARMIAAKINKDCASSRDWKVKIDLTSQGVIYGGQLWFWSDKTGYQKGPWTPGEGRPALHKVIWETVHGRKVPPAHVVRFTDGNPNNFEPSNLVLCTRNELCRENQAKALTRKSRDLTAALLRRSQQTDHGHDLISRLARRTA